MNGINLMSEILFVNPPTPSPLEQSSYSSMSPPLGIGYVAACLREASFSVSAVDLGLSANPTGDLKDAIYREEPRVIAFYTLTQTYRETERLFALVRETHPEAITWVGGPHVTYRTQEALDSGFDVVFRFEAEYSAVQVANSQLRGRGRLNEIPGIAFLEDGNPTVTPQHPRIKDLDSLPFPARDLFPIHRYPRPGTIMSSRGCPIKCIFCIASTFEDDYRYRSPDNVMAELVEMYETWGINDFYFTDNVFTTHRSRAIRIAELIRESRLPIGWYCVSRVDYVTPELMQHMASAGCYRIELGVESANIEVIKKLKKRITIDQVYEACNIILSFGMQPMFTFQVGHPNDTSATIEQTLSLAAELRARGAGTYLAITTPYPGTPLYENRDEYNIRMLTLDWDDFRWSNPVYETDHFTRNDLKKAVYRDAVSMQQLVRSGRFLDPPSAPWLRFDGSRESGYQLPPPPDEEENPPHTLGQRPAEPPRQTGHHSNLSISPLKNPRETLSD